MAEMRTVPIFGPDGKVHAVPVEHQREALAAGGELALKMKDPQGMSRWVPASHRDEAIRAGGQLISDPGQPQVLPPAARPAAPGAAPVPPRTITQKIYGDSPATGTLANAAAHLGQFVTGPIHAFTDPADPNDPTEQNLAKLPAPLAHLETGVYRMSAKPTVDALRNARKALKDGNLGLGFGHSDYDAQGNYHPSVASSVMDALPMVGPWARNIETEAVNKGALPAIAGGMSDMLAPELAGKLPAAPMALRDAALRRVVPPSLVDEPLPGDTVTPRQRFIAAKNQGVNLDLAQATGAKVPAVLKKVTEHSLMGAPKFEANNAANVDALHAHVGKVLDGLGAGGPMSREDLGAYVRQRLSEHKDMLRQQQGLEDTARELLADASPEEMSREQFGSYMQKQLKADQRNRYESAGQIFKALDDSHGQQLLGGKTIQDTARKILDENRGFYDRNPEMLSGGTARAWAVLKRLAGEAAPGRDTRGASSMPGSTIRASRPATRSAALAQGAAIPGQEGAAASLLTPSRELPAQYRAVEAGSLVPSHDAQTFAPNAAYPEGVQERAYDTSKDAQQRVIEQGQNYDPRYTVNSNPDAVNGPPVITPDGVVLGGNSRAMATQRHYAAGGTAYRDFLQQNADKFGLDPKALGKMKQPVLVRQVEAPATIDDARRLGTEFNKSMTGALGVSERAVSAGRNLKPDTLQQIGSMMQDGDLSLRELLGRHGADVLRMLGEDGVITDRERPEFTDTASGGLSEEGKTFVERALMGSLVDDPRLMDAVPKSVLGKLERSLGHVSAFAGRPDEWNIAPSLREALAEHATIARSGNSVENHLGQQGIFGGDERNPVVDVLVRKLDDKPTAVRNAFEAYARDADQNPVGQTSMFGGRGAHEAFNEAFGTNLAPEAFEHGVTDSASTNPAATVPEQGAEGDGGIRASGAPGAASGSAAGAGSAAAGPASAGSGGAAADGSPAARVASQPDPQYSYGDLHRLRSHLMDMYQSPDIVGSPSEGWMKQMAAATDNEMTNGETGLPPDESRLFRQGGEIWSGMKADYDNPQSKLYHVLRAPDGLSAANHLADVTPDVAGKVRAASESLDEPGMWGQMQRQTMSRLFDPAGNGDIDLDGLASRWEKAQKEKMAGVLTPEHMEVLDYLADRAGERGPYDAPGSKLHRILNAPDASTAANALDRPTPETMRQIQQAGEDLKDPNLLPQVQRHVAEMIVNPEGNASPDLRTLPTRFKRLQKDQLGGVLPPDTIQQLEDLARTAKVVHADSNPSGTAKTLQPTAEAASLGAGAAAAVPSMASGHVIPAVASVVLPAAATMARGAAARVLTSPAITEGLMTPKAPRPPRPPSAAAAIQEAGAINQQKSSSDADLEGVGGTEGNEGAPPPDKPGMTPLASGPYVPPTPPAGATHEVLSPDGQKVTGHIVDGDYVPLEEQEQQ